jgi:uncharacterized protein (DUF4415 family)
MKKKRTIAKKRRKIARLRASVDEEKLPLDLVPQWSKYYKPLKKPVTLRLDADVLAWFKKQGRGYQTRINRALRKAMTDEKRWTCGNRRGCKLLIMLRAWCGQIATSGYLLRCNYYRTDNLMGGHPGRGKRMTSSGETIGKGTATRLRIGVLH